MHVCIGMRVDWTVFEITVLAHGLRVLKFGADQSRNLDANWCDDVFFVVIQSRVICSVRSWGIGRR